MKIEYKRQIDDTSTTTSVEFDKDEKIDTDKLCDILSFLGFPIRTEIKIDPKDFK